MFLITSYAALFLAAPLAQAWRSKARVFTANDILGDLEGNTFGDDRRSAGGGKTSTIICGVEDDGITSSACDHPDEPTLLSDGERGNLYPIDSDFAFDAIDFVGLKRRKRDNVHVEGYAANIKAGDDIIGVKVANTGPAEYKVPPPIGTWCQGVGSNSVKCSTNHYSVMEHALTCHESVPYYYADPVTGVQGTQVSGSLLVNCSEKSLSNVLHVLHNGVPNGTVFTSLSNPPMAENGNKDALNNVAVGANYSVTMKDGGKALYRWGNLVKKPTDLRVSASIALPEQWHSADAPAEGYKLTKALLAIRHTITNNPNDQIRPEDMESEAATGRKPDYYASGYTWKSMGDCWEGDGHFIQPGTVLRSTFCNETKNLECHGLAGHPPALLSGGLAQGYTAGYFTTMNRDPFEWSYLKLNADPNVNEFEGTSKPLGDSEQSSRDLTLVSGPRWRLKANKFGQDLPGLSIPLQDCSEPPFKKDNYKYSVGDLTTTVINLLDWDESKGPSPLATSNGWIDWTKNKVVNKTVREIHGRNVSASGLVLTDEFDFAVFIKGDMNPVSLYAAQLLISYEGEPKPDYDISVNVVRGPMNPKVGNVASFIFSIKNLGPGNFYNDNNYKYQAEYTDNSGNVITPDDLFHGFQGVIPDIGAGKVVVLTWIFGLPYPSISITNNSNLQANIKFWVDKNILGKGEATYSFLVKENNVTGDADVEGSLSSIDEDIAGSLPVSTVSDCEGLRGACSQGQRHTSISAFVSVLHFSLSMILLVV